MLIFFFLILKFKKILLYLTLMDQFIFSCFNHICTSWVNQNKYIIIIYFQPSLKATGLTKKKICFISYKIWGGRVFFYFYLTLLNFGDCGRFSLLLDQLNRISTNASLESSSWNLLLLYFYFSLLFPEEKLFSINLKIREKDPLP